MTDNVHIGWRKVWYDARRPSECPNCPREGRGMYRGWYGTSEALVCVYKCITCNLDWACRFSQVMPQDANFYDMTTNKRVLDRLGAHPPHLGSPQIGVLWPSDQKGHDAP